MAKDIRFGTTRVSRRRLLPAADSSNGTRTYNLGVSSVLLCGLLLFATPADELFHEVEVRVGRDLTERDVGAWARALAAEPMPNAPDATFERLIVASLAGHEVEAKRVLDDMAELSAERQRELECVGMFLLGRDDYELARHAHDRLPHMHCGWTYVLVRVLAAREDPEKLEQWLARQASINRAYIDDQAWFAKRRGKLDRILEKLERAILDKQSLRLFLRVASRVNARWRLDNLPGRFQPKSRYATYEVGCLLSTSYPCVALVYLERSLRMPFTDEDTRLFGEVRRGTGVDLFSGEAPSDPKTLLPGWTKRQLLSLYHRTGQPKRAQALLEEIAKDYPDGIPSDFVRFAGQVQARSGERVIAKRVEEAPGKDTAKYWLQRASYYDGRAEYDEVARSYLEAIQLVTKEQKTRIVLQFADWATHRQRIAQAAPSMRERMRSIDVASRSFLDLAMRIPDGDESLWKHLSAVERWGKGQQDVLERLARGSSAARRDLVWKRAERLAKDKDPSRASTLAWMMLRLGEPARAAGHYAEAIARLPEGEERERLRWYLYRAHKEAGHWKEALALWQAARKHLGVREAPRHQRGLAVCCARAGQRKLAMRLWAQSTNFDRMNFQGLDDMVDAGLRQELTAYYTDLAKADPLTLAPKRALALLESN